MKKGKKVINQLTGDTYKSVAQAIKILKIPSRTIYRNLKTDKYFLKYE